MAIPITNPDTDWIHIATLVTYALADLCTVLVLLVFNLYLLLYFLMDCLFVKIVVTTTLITQIHYVTDGNYIMQ